MSGLCTAFHALLSSGAEFAESEDYLAFRFRLLNTVMLTGLVFSGLGLQFSGLGVLLFVLTLGYLFFAVQSVALLQDKAAADDILEV